MKVREVESKLMADGWHLERTGKHMVYKHVKSAEIIVVPNHPNDELAKGTLESIRKKAGWK